LPCSRYSTSSGLIFSPQASSPSTQFYDQAPTLTLPQRGRELL
jgi:hypothetical protein